MKTATGTRLLSWQGGIVLLLTLSPVLGWGQAGPAPEIYSCVDAKGHRITSDRKIPSCNDREQKLLNPSGTVKATVGPTLTAQEKIQQEAKEKVAMQERARQDEEKKRDRALLIRYPNETLHQKERAEALAQIAVVKQAATVRAAELSVDYGKLQDEMAFYAKDPKRAPTKLRMQLNAAKLALDGQDHFIADKDLEAARTNARFDEELQRLRPLWRMNAASATQ
jgi:hypothetical protein